MNGPQSKPDINERLEQLAEAMRLQQSISEQVLADLQGRDGDAVESDVDPRPDLSLRSKKSGEQTMLRRLSIGSVCAALVGVVTIWLATSNDSVSLAQVVEQVRKATSCVADVSMQTLQPDGSRKIVMQGKNYWRAPGDFRQETQMIRPADDVDRPVGREGNEVQIVSLDKPGIRLDLKRKEFRRVAAKRGVVSPILMLHELSKYKNLATKQLGKKSINGVDCEGFEVELEAVDPSAGAGTMTVWVDQRVQLPVKLNMEMKHVPAEMIVENFQWNVELDQALFDTNPPAGFTDKTKAAPKPDEVAADVVNALKLFAEMSGGKYPQVKMIYGDVTRNKMMELAGFTAQEPQEWLRSDRYVEIVQATRGFALMNEIMATDADAVYDGLTVTAVDKDKVLFQWNTDSGSPMKIWGDLRVSRDEKK